MGAKTKERYKLSEKAKEILEWVYCIIIALVLAVLFRYFIGTPTIVKQVSMKPTLIENERLWLNRWTRTTHTLPQRGEIITFEEPDKIDFRFTKINIENPVAQYDDESAFEWFVKSFLEIGKKSYIKRVIALPNEYVEIKDGKVYVDGKQLEESYLQEGVVTEVPTYGINNFKVPENCVFAMGDNREHSMDCRDFGCIPLEKIESKVWIRVTPFNKFGKI